MNIYKGLNEKGEAVDVDLSGKQEEFCQLIVRRPDAFGSTLAKEAGYKPDNAKTISSQNLSKLHLQHRIAYLKANIVETVGLSRIGLADILKNAILFNPLDLFEESLEEVRDKEGEVVGNRRTLQVKDIDDIRKHGELIDRVDVSRGDIKLAMMNKLKSIEMYKDILNDVEQAAAFYKSKSIRSMKIEIETSDGEIIDLSAAVNGEYEPDNKESEGDNGDD